MYAGKGKKSTDRGRRSQGDARIVITRDKQVLIGKNIIGTTVVFPVLAAIIIIIVIHYYYYYYE